MNMYEVKKIVTTCPHCFNTLKNEYPELGGQLRSHFSCSVFTTAHSMRAN
jgi:Fe-S oxidoreductase